MTTTLESGFSIHINQRRWACVLDPTLALSTYGLPLVKHLGELMELWIVRELWHILDNPRFYLHHPDAISSQTLVTPDVQTFSPSDQVIQALKEWERLRTTTDRNSWNIHFLADVIGESCIPPGIETDIIWRWESLAQSLDSHISQNDTAALAFRDLAALAAARPARILTHHTHNEPPAICSTFEQWGIPCRQVATGDAIADIECQQFRTLLVHAGLSKFIWAGLNLAVLHLVVPAAATLNSNPSWSDEFSFLELEELTTMQTVPSQLWEGAQCFWYSIR